MRKFNLWLPKGKSKYNNYFPLGYFHALDKNDYINKFNELLSIIDEGNILSIIPTIVYIDGSGSQKAMSVKSSKLSNKTNLKFYADMIIDQIRNLIDVYSFNNIDILIILKYRYWIPEKEYDSIRDELKEILNKQLESEMNNKYNNPEKFDKLVEFKQEKAFDYRYKDVFINQYGHPLIQNNIFIGYKLSSYTIATPTYNYEN